MTFDPHRACVTRDGRTAVYRGLASLVWGKDADYLFTLNLASGSNATLAFRRDGTAVGNQRPDDLFNVPAEPAFDPHKPCRTRDGREARFVSMSTQSHYPYVFSVPERYAPGDWFDVTITKDGRFYQSGIDDRLDLFNYTPDPTPMPKKFDPTKPVQTRDGRAARILCTDMKCGDKADGILALIADKSSGEVPFTFHADGVWITARSSEMDLVNIPEEHTVWIAAVRRPEGSMCTWLCASEAEARAHPRKGFKLLACFPVTYKEGQGLP